MILMTLWSLLLLMYVTGGRALYTDDPDYMRRQLCFGSVLLLFWSAIPYFLFGDIFRISEKISPNNPRNGLYVLRILGAASFVVGFPADYRPLTVYHTQPNDLYAVSIPKKRSNRVSL